MSREDGAGWLAQVAEQILRKVPVRPRISSLRLKGAILQASACTSSSTRGNHAR